MDVLWLLAAILGLLVIPAAESTVALATITAGLTATAPVLGVIGGLSAIKILKLVGLSKLQSAVGGAGDYDGFDYDDRPYYNDPPVYGPRPLYDGPPLFYVVPRDYYDTRRGKRSIQNADELAATTSGDQAQTIREKDYFNIISSLDARGCVLRLVCELAQTPEDQLKEDERVIMSSFQTPIAPTSSAIQTPKGVYDYAAWIGRNSANNPESCKTIYDKCSYNATEIMEAFRLMEAEEIYPKIQEVSQAL